VWSMDAALEDAKVRATAAERKAATATRELQASRGQTEAPLCAMAICVARAGCPCKTQKNRPTRGLA
jgi:hypothetical protein